MNRMSKPAKPLTVVALVLSVTIIITVLAFLAGERAGVTPDMTVAPCGAHIANTIPGVCVAADGTLVAR